MPYVLPATVLAVALISLALSPNAGKNDSFFRGHNINGQAPGLLMLVFSQVTTWIFARSLMNAAILGYYYGLWGTLAYATYYLSFLTGGLIIDSLRFRHNCNSVQDFLRQRFGTVGTRCYNLVIGVRLISEVFANLLVFGLLFGAAGSQQYIGAIAAFSLLTLFYAGRGGLHASLRTDVFQMGLFLAVLLTLVALMLGHSEFSTTDFLFKPFEFSDPGVVLIAVALLQVISYPMHDPVMMDRGFIADRKTTQRSFLHASWISVFCIILFGLLGVFAGAHAQSGEAMNAVLTRLLGEVPMLLFSFALVISAMSTLDSTLSSAAKLIVSDMKLGVESVANGRKVMVLFMLAGLVMIYLGPNDLFSAVAVSGTASMYLTPVILFSLWGGRIDIPVWSYLVAFIVALAGAGLYFTETAGYLHLMEPLFGTVHKYNKLLVICLAVLAVGCGAFALGMQLSRKKIANVVYSAGDA
ncbi:sodium:proline symporter [Kistimonas asteriae]|uniref:sodium:proline symporter n=1 Tax=Kistimonas asteriae TaxID=517724 RepID=UPI001BA4D2A8|nr:sodium:proline symporter [Kistimonas asteriae]